MNAPDSQPKEPADSHPPPQAPPCGLCLGTSIMDWEIITLLGLIVLLFGAVAVLTGPTAILWPSPLSEDPVCTDPGRIAGYIKCRQQAWAPGCSLSVLACSVGDSS